MQLRPYQQECSDAIIDHITKTLSSCIVDCPTGSGKSMIVADVAKRIHKLSGKKILCLAPSGELVEQNHSKYLLTGNAASLYSASLGKKSLRHDVVFGSPLTVANSLHKFGNFAAVIVDECFHPDTLISTEIGMIKISDDRLPFLKIHCYNELTGAIELDYPVKVWNNGTKNISLLKHENGYLKCTNTHKFFIEGSWIRATDIKQGQKMTLDGSQDFVMKKLLRASAAVAKRLFQMFLEEVR